MTPALTVALIGIQSESTDWETEVLPIVRRMGVDVRGIAFELPPHWYEPYLVDWIPLFDSVPYARTVHPLKGIRITLPEDDLDFVSLRARLRTCSDTPI